MNRVLQEVYGDLMKCNKCGFCQANCRVYKEVLEEGLSARGRLRLIKAVADGELARTEDYVQKVQACLQCKECAVSCPSGVNPDRIILAARRDQVETRGLGIIKRLAVRGLFASRRRLDLSFRSFRMLQKLFLSWMPGLAKIRGINLRKFPVAERPFLVSFGGPAPGYSTPGVPTPSGSTPGGPERVAFFTGCMIDNALPGIGKAVVEVLERNGRKVILPREQQCCGTPMYISGDLQTARKVARTNVELFNSLGVGAVVVACASCGLALKKEYREFFKDDPAFLPQVEAFSAKVRDISEYLVEQALVDPALLGRLQARVTYHDPCHLVRGQGVAAQPRSLLKAIPGVDFAEMAEADRCCGAAGMFQAFYPEIAGPITRRKIGNIAATQAEYVVTGCPACLQRIQGGLDLHKMPQKAVHIVELLNMAYQAAENTEEKRDRVVIGSR